MNTKKDICLFTIIILFFWGCRDRSTTFSEGSNNLQQLTKTLNTKNTSDIIKATKDIATKSGENDNTIHKRIESLNTKIKKVDNEISKNKDHLVKLYCDNMNKCLQYLKTLQTATQKVKLNVEAFNTALAHHCTIPHTMIRNKLTPQDLNDPNTKKCDDIYDKAKTIAHELIDKIKKDSKDASTSKKPKKPASPPIPDAKVKDPNSKVIDKKLPGLPNLSCQTSSKEVKSPLYKVILNSDNTEKLATLANAKTACKKAGMQLYSHCSIITDSVNSTTTYNQSVLNGINKAPPPQYNNHKALLTPNQSYWISTYNKMAGFPNGVQPNYNILESSIQKNGEYKNPMPPNHRDANKKAAILCECSNWSNSKRNDCSGWWSSHK